MHDDRDSAAFAVRSLLDIDAVVDAYCEADAVRRVAERAYRRATAAWWQRGDDGVHRWVETRAPDAKTQRVLTLLNQWADAREASVAAMLEG